MREASPSLAPSPLPRIPARRSVVPRSFGRSFARPPSPSSPRPLFIGARMRPIKEEEEEEEERGADYEERDVGRETGRSRSDRETSLSTRIEGTTNSEVDQHPKGDLVPATLRKA